jgi:hypothetical protein
LGPEGLLQTVPLLTSTTSNKEDQQQEEEGEQQGPYQGGSTVHDIAAPQECVEVYSYVTIVERVEIVRGAWIYYQALEF